MDKRRTDKLYAQITLPAELKILPCVISFVREIGNNLGLSEIELNRLELIVEVACVNVINYAFDPGEEGLFDVIFIRRPGQLVIVIQDKGLPSYIRKIEKDKDAGLGLILMKAFADEIQILNMGKKGNRVELVKNLKYKDVVTYMLEEGKEEIRELPPVENEPPLKFRLMTPGDSLNLSRCLYRSYGYTYPFDFVYYPDKINEFLESKLRQACIIINSKDEIVAHLALTLEHPKAKTGKSENALVDPRYRGKGLFTKMKKFLYDYGRLKKMY